MKKRHEQAIFLKAIAKANPKQRKQLLLSLPNDVIKLMCEVLHNILRETIKIPPSQRNMLYKYKQAIRDLGNSPFCPLLKKRQLLYKQKGGFLGAVLPIIASILLNVWKISCYSNKSQETYSIKETYTNKEEAQETYTDKEET